MNISSGGIYMYSSIRKQCLIPGNKRYIRIYMGGKESQLCQKTTIHWAAGVFEKQTHKLHTVPLELHQYRMLISGVGKSKRRIYRSEGGPNPRLGAESIIRLFAHFHFSIDLDLTDFIWSPGKI